MKESLPDSTAFEHPYKEGRLLPGVKTTLLL
jgi:hypothetical protein